MSNLVIFFLITVPLFTQADITSGAVALGMANGGTASVQPHDLSSQNPASLPHLTGVWLSGGMANSTINKTMTEEKYFSLSENTFESFIPSALLYKKRTIENLDFSEQDLRLSIGDFYLPKVALGISGIYRRTSFLSKTWTQSTFSVGSLWAPIPEVGLGFLFENIAPSSNKVPALSKFEQKIKVGSTYLFSTFVRFRLDFEKNESTKSFDGIIGFESLLNDFLIFRGALGSDDVSNSTKSAAGMSFVGPKFNIHYGFQQVNTKQRQLMHAVDFNIPF